MDFIKHMQNIDMQSNYSALQLVSKADLNETQWGPSCQSGADNPETDILSAKTMRKHTCIEIPF